MYVTLASIAGGLSGMVFAPIVGPINVRGENKGWVNGYVEGLEE